MAQLRDCLWQHKGEIGIRDSQARDVSFVILQPSLSRLLKRRKFVSVPSTNSISHRLQIPQPKRFHLIFNWCFNHFSYQLIRFSFFLSFGFFSVQSLRPWKFKAVSLFDCFFRLWLAPPERSRVVILIVDFPPFVFVYIHFVRPIGELCHRRRSADDQLTQLTVRKAHLGK